MADFGKLSSKLVSMMGSAKKNGAVVSTWENVMAVLEEAGFAHTVPSIPPGHVIVHPENRSKMLVSTTGSHALGVKIARQGWSDAKSMQSTCIELPTDPVERELILKANKKPAWCIPTLLSMRACTFMHGLFFQPRAAA